MRRSVRNGIAIAGMAGGMWFLGHAVANAAETPASSDAGITQDAGGSGHSTNLNSGDATAKAVNVSKTDVTSTNTGGSATNNAVVTNNVSGGSGGVQPASDSYKKDGDHGEHHSTPSSTVNGGDTTVNQNATAGSVNNSGNVAVAPKGNQTATATALIGQKATSTGSDSHGDKWKSDHKSYDHNHNGSSNFNNGDATATSKNKDVTDVTTTNTGGDASNSATVINNYYCPEHGPCTINGGDTTINQTATGGSVNSSGNVGIGAPVPGMSNTSGPCECVKPVPAPAPCPKATVAPAAIKPVAMVMTTPKKTVVLSSAQPTGQLAVTGADTSLPLTAGLIALGAGLALTLATSRRRETETV